MNNEGNRKLALTLIALGVIISFFGGSLAYWNWETSTAQRTLVSVQVQGATLTIQGENIEHTGMYPTNDCDGPGALIGEVATATAVNGTASDMEVILKIRATLSVNQGTLTSDKKSKLKWAIIDTSTSATCDTTPYRGTLADASTNTDIDTGIRFTATAKETTSRSYRLYVWLDSTYTHTNVGDVVSDPMQNIGISVKYSPASELVQSESSVSGGPNAPVLDNGMIPIKISADGVATTVSSSDSTWYNYSNKEWANVVLVKESGTQTRDYYKSNVGVTVAEDDILAYFVWIPRYKYKILRLAGSLVSEQTIDIVFESSSASITQGSQVGDYITHPAFIWDGTAVAGIWVGKFETGHLTLTSTYTENNLGCINENCANADGLIVKPNVATLSWNNLSNLFYASRSMVRNSNPFGMDSSTTDSHMVKNSEWGAVAYLSHSQYGINNEIYINNSSKYTGRSGGNVGGSHNTLAEQFPDASTSTNTYNANGYYTWTGQEISFSGTIGSYASNRTLGTNASTTGNVTGIYDMSGGSNEFVMAWYSGANSNYATDTSYFGWITLSNGLSNAAGFTTNISSKYWDEYTTTINYNACNGSPCLGHAYSETYGWYDNTTYSMSENSPWFARGGVYNFGSGTGIWSYHTSSGSSNTGVLRVVIIVGV